MEVRPGYKQTEAGVVPDEWEIAPLGSLFSFQNGVNADRACYGRGVRFVNVLEPITFSHLNGSEIPGRVTLPDDVVSAFAVKRGDVLFNRTSETQEQLGLAATYVGQEQVVFGGFVIRGRPTGQSLDAVYSGHALRAPAIRAQIIPLGQGAIRSNLSQENLRRILAPVPPLAEQRAIAGALGDVGALLDGLDRLIAKERDLKQAAMQQLLTGRTRLPGISAETDYVSSELGKIPVGWAVRPLLAAVRVVSGQVDPRVEPYRSMTLVAPDHIESGTGRLIARHTAAEQRAISGKYMFRRGDVLYSKIRPHLRKATLAEFDGLCSADMYALRPVAGMSSRFMLAVLLDRPFSSFAESVSARSGMPKINRSELAGYRLALPPSDEQAAIAEVLSDMDAELAALEARREKTRLLKQGMMQELLTGRIRLV